MMCLVLIMPPYAGNVWLGCYSLSASCCRTANFGTSGGGGVLLGFAKDKLTA